ncbi:MAG: ATP-binding protein [Flavobacteriaceae bacterium]|nr:ATP-binding protein [Flavobacteriaceae bacterium]
MKTSLKKEITAAAKNYMDAHKMRQSDFGNKVGLNSSLLTHIFRLNSNFTIPTGGDKDTVIADKYFMKMANFIGFELTKSYWDIKATPQLTAILATLEDAKQHGTTAVIVGETGAGKTHALRLFQRKNPMDTLIVTVGSNDNITDLIERICDVLHITSGKTRSRKLRNIYWRLQELRENGHNPQLILDEAEYMKQPALSAIKEIYDHVNDHASLVLVGTQQLIENIDQLRKKNRPGMPQFYRRIKFGIRTLPAVDRRYSLFIDGLSKEVVQYLQIICDNYGELHDVLVPVRREAERTEQEITVNLIKTVLNLR